MWTLSLIFSVLGSATNLFFSLRYPSVTITPVIALLLVHPLGLLWDAVLKRPDDPEEVFIDGVLDRHNFSSPDGIESRDSTTLNSDSDSLTAESRESCSSRMSVRKSSLLQR